MAVNNIVVTKREGGLLSRFFQLVILQAVLLGRPATASLNTTELEEAFANFEKKFAREYESLEERAKRMAIFAENLAYIVEENAKGHKYKLGLNEFSDLSFDEFKEHHLGLLPPPTVGLNLGVHTDVLRAPADFVPPTSMDWVAKGAVTPVRNQGRCGSCWSFSTAGAVEGAVFLATGKLQELSKENLVDCDNSPLSGDKGCNGGLPLRAYEYVKDHGLCSEADYPYAAGNGSATECHACASPAVKPNVITGGQQVGTNQQDLLAAVTKQPVSVAVEADKMAFQHYQSGVLTGSACGTNLDHAVLLVGFGQDEDDMMNGPTPYWKVKNSWGPTWGENGFIRLERGVGTEGECGILQMATVPTMAGDTPDWPPQAEETIVV